MSSAVNQFFKDESIDVAVVSEIHWGLLPNAKQYGNMQIIYNSWVWDYITFNYDTKRFVGGKWGVALFIRNYFIVIKSGSFVRSLFIFLKKKMREYINIYFVPFFSPWLTSVPLGNA